MRTKNCEPKKQINVFQDSKPRCKEIDKGTAQLNCSSKTILFPKNNNKYVPKFICFKSTSLYARRLTEVKIHLRHQQINISLKLRTPGPKTKTFHNAPGPKICCTNTSRDPFQTTNQTKPMIKLIDICITQQL